ncbi:uncharacterized protein BDR25DRAFT_124370 [Lindgomyces ingoldianus]|uniref:Uncharacterized protein n=1 Tax=Lindgomyces ingoldianus TaxID=673940 RepID=A0ACB6R326_9PLEO|nr:uncharacterized protein BDR25DRAFT_124370 [Lindgomyces ingoldianus]KAF2473668.1 hypothetical protein BDR25DRAFT_124370 [Lindgomyces ingoldianus]
MTTKQSNSARKRSLSLSQPQTRTSRKFDIACGINRPFADKTRVPADCLLQCIDKCASFHPPCVAFDSANENCWLKSADTERLQNQGIIIVQWQGVLPMLKKTVVPCTTDIHPKGWILIPPAAKPTYIDSIRTHSVSFKDCIGQYATYMSTCAGVSYKAFMKHGYNNCYFKPTIWMSGLMMQYFVVDTAFVVNNPARNSHLASTSKVSPIQTGFAAITAAPGSLCQQISSPLSSTMPPGLCSIYHNCRPAIFTPKSLVRKRSGRAIGRDLCCSTTLSGLLSSRKMTSISRRASSCRAYWSEGVV